MAFFSETIYKCRQQLAYCKYHWEGNSDIPICNRCDNCLKRQHDNVILVDLKNEVLIMINIVKILLISTSTGESKNKVSADDVVDVFMGGNNKNIRANSLNTIDEFGRGKKTNIKTRDIAFHLLDKIILNGLVKRRIIVKHRGEGLTGFTHSEELVNVVNEQEAADIINNHNWELYLHSAQSKANLLNC